MEVEVEVRRRRRRRRRKEGGRRRSIKKQNLHQGVRKKDLIYNPIIFV